MIRVHVLVEGETEVTFVKEVLLPYFVQHEIHLLPEAPREAQTQKGHLRVSACSAGDPCYAETGGTKPSARPCLIITPMPPTWPNGKEARHKPFAEKPVTVESGDIGRHLRRIGGGDCTARC